MLKQGDIATARAFLYKDLTSLCWFACPISGNIYM